MGILYVASQKKYIEEAKVSAKSAKKHGLSTALFCKNLKVDKEKFDYVRKIKNSEGGFIDKINPLKKTPFNRTLFLDTDTVVLEEIDEIFKLLDKYDIAYSHAPVRRNEKYKKTETPRPFFQPNTGVILYKKEQKVMRFIEDWRELYKQQLKHMKEPPNDQPSFQEAIFKSNLKDYILPPEYNLRIPFPYFIGGNESVKIIHGRGSRLEREKEKIESIRRNRFMPRVYPIINSYNDMVSEFGTKELVLASILGIANKIYSITKIFNVKKES